LIETRVGDIFEQEDLTHLIHQANLFHTFGSGIAREIARRYPLAEAADRRTKYGSRAKLGTYSTSVSSDTLLFGRTGPVIINLYSQDGLSATHRTTHYAALGAALLHLEYDFTDQENLMEFPVLGIPHGIGCGLAGGDWAVVRAIIDSAFKASPVRVVICRKNENCPECGRPELMRSSINEDDVEYKCDRGHRWADEKENEL